MELWSPVITVAGYASEEYLVLGERPSKKKELITGFAKLTIDKVELKKQLNILLLKSILIGFVFWSIGSLLIFIMTRVMKSEKTAQIQYQTSVEAQPQTMVSIQYTRTTRRL